MGVYCASSLLFYFFMYRPMVNGLGRLRALGACAKHWPVVRRVHPHPSEVPEFKRLNQSVKEHKDKEHNKMDTPLPMSQVLQTTLRSEVLQADIVKHVIKEGSGPLVHPNSKVWVVREGRTQDGELFQKTSKYVLTIGSQADRIHSSGWSIALYSMRAQEDAWFLIGPNDHMFTEEELEGKTLWFHFYVEHFKITAVPQLAKGCPLADRIASAQFFFDEGRRAFAVGFWAEAVTAFNSAKQAVQFKKTELSEMSPEDQASVAEVVQRAQLNCGITHLRQAEQEKDAKRKLGLLNKGGPLLTEILSRDPEHSKALYHLTKYHLMKSELKEARKVVRAALQVSPTDAAVLALSAKVDKLIMSTGSTKQKMCRRIFLNWEAELENERIQRLQAAYEARDLRVTEEEPSS